MKTLLSFIFILAPLVFSSHQEATFEEAVDFINRYTKDKRISTLKCTGSNYECSGGRDVTEFSANQYSHQAIWEIKGDEFKDRAHSDGSGGRAFFEEWTERVDFDLKDIVEIGITKNKKGLILESSNDRGFRIKKKYSERYNQIYGNTGYDFPRNEMDKYEEDFEQTFFLYLGSESDVARIENAFLRLVELSGGTIRVEKF